VNDSEGDEGAASTEQRSGEAQRLRAGAGTASQHPKAGQVVNPGAGLMGHREVFKTELPHLARGGADQTELQLKDNAVAAW
jgi:hypothetical protein